MASHEDTYLLPSSFNKGQGDHVKTTAINPTAPYRSTNPVKNVAKSLHVSPIGETLAELFKFPLPLSVTLTVELS
jgi:hypothetical protein